MKEKVFVYGGALAAIIALAFGFSMFAQKAKAERKAIQDSGVAESADAKRRPVYVVRMFPQRLEDMLRLPGSVEADEDIDLAAKTAGVIEWMGSKEGDAVRKGDQLLQIDVTERIARADQARVGLELAKQKFERARQLRAQDVVSSDEFDDAEAGMKSAQAALDAAEAEVADGAIDSPIDGIVDRRPVDAGEHVNAGQTVMKLVDIDRVKIVANVPEKDVAFFRSGAPVRFNVETAGQVKAMEGVVEYVALTADMATRTYPLKIRVNNPGHFLRPGMIIERLGLARRDIADAMLVPMFCIVDREDGKAVFVAEDGVARKRAIEYGVFQNGLVEITRGLAPGDQLIVVGQRDLVDGETVVPRDATPMAREFLAGGGDLSKLVSEISRLEALLATGAGGGAYPPATESGTGG